MGNLESISQYQKTEQDYSRTNDDLTTKIYAFESVQVKGISFYFQVQRWTTKVPRTKGKLEVSKNPLKLKIIWDQLHKTTYRKGMQRNNYA